ncbi:hypothetical protein SH501x_002281 [Pirellulaceae bacterium SH501]
MPLFALMSLFADEPVIVTGPAAEPMHVETAPAHDPPQIVVASAIGGESLFLVNFTTIYIGSNGESYNTRTVTKTSLKDVNIFTIKGQRVSVEEAARKILGKDTPILCSSWNAPLPEFYASMFKPETLHFVFPKESPAWKKIQEPGRPIR